MTETQRNKIQRIIAETKHLKAKAMLYENLGPKKNPAADELFREAKKGGDINWFNILYAFAMLSIFVACLIMFGCCNTAVKQETAIAEASTETRCTLQIQTGQTVMEAAMQADSVIVIRTDTLTVAKYYAVRKTETVRDTLTLVRVDTLARADTVRIMAKTEEIQNAWYFNLPWYLKLLVLIGAIIIGWVIIGGIILSIKDWRNE